MLPQETVAVFLHAKYNTLKDIWEAPKCMLHIAGSQMQFKLLHFFPFLFVHWAAEISMSLNPTMEKMIVA